MVSCKSATNPSTIDGIYCLKQAYYTYKSNTMSTAFVATSTRKTSDSKFCLNIRSFDDTSGAIQAVGQYGMWVTTSTGDSTVYPLLYYQTEDGFYAYAVPFYYFSFVNGAGEWIPQLRYQMFGNTLFGQYGYSDSVYAESLTVQFVR